MTDNLASDNLTNETPLRSIRSSLFRAGSLIAFGSLFSRLLGFAVEGLKSHYFGASGLVDAFNTAQAVPGLLNDLLITSLVNSALIPVLSAYSLDPDSDPREMWRLISALLTLTIVVSVCIVLGMEGLAPQLVSLLIGSAPSDVQALAVQLLRIALPALLAFGISGILTALLFSRRRFALPTFASLMLNGAVVVSTLALQARLGIFAMAVGLLVGALLQMALQAVGLRYIEQPKQDRRLHLIFWHPGLRRIGTLYLPIALGLLLEIFVSRPSTFALAAQTGTGGIAWMNYALTLRQLPEGLIASALAVAILPALASASRINGIFKETLTQGLRLTLLLIIPATVGLFMLAAPTVALLFEHGSFTAFDTQITAQALQLYLIGLPFAAIDLLLVMAFYARQDTWHPALIGIFSTLLYIGLMRLLVPIYGLRGIMIADSVRYMVHAFVSAFLLRRAFGSALSRTLWLTFAAAGIMGIAVAVTQRISPGGSKVLSVLIPVGAGATVYITAIAALGIEEFRLVRFALRRRLSATARSDEAD